LWKYSIENKNEVKNYLLFLGIHSFQFLHSRLVEASRFVLIILEASRFRKLKQHFSAVIAIPPHLAQSVFHLCLNVASLFYLRLQTVKCTGIIFIYQRPRQFSSLVKVPPPAHRHKSPPLPPHHKLQVNPSILRIKVQTPLFRKCFHLH
jgi:hypothetical protein